LHPLALGDSGKAHVGDPVLAIPIDLVKGELAGLEKG
jgi:hypothetical protein